MKKKLFLTLSIISFIYFIIVAIFDGPDSSCIIFWPILTVFFLILAFQDENRYLKKIPARIYKAAEIGIAVAAALFIVFCGFCIWGTTIDSEEQADYLIVLGGGLDDTEPDPALTKRLERALEYMEESTDTLLILTGGQTEAEVMPIAKCMYDWLVERGADSSRLIMEIEATSTEENFLYCLEYVEILRDKDKVSIGVLTSNFHIFRSLCVAKRIAGDNEHYDFHGVSAPTPIVILPHLMAREFLAATLYTVRGDLALPV